MTKFLLYQNLIYKFEFWTLISHIKTSKLAVSHIKMYPLQDPICYVPTGMVYPFLSLVNHLSQKTDTLISIN